MDAVTLAAARSFTASTPAALGHNRLQVGKKARFPWGGSSNGTDTGVNVRLRQTSPIPVRGLILRLGNFGNISGGNEGVPANNITVRGAVEFNSISAGVGGLVFWPFFFGGKRDVVIEPGGSAESELLGIDLPAGAAWWLRLYCTVPAGGTWPLGTLALVSDTDGTRQGTTETDMTTSGTFSAMGGDTITFGPIGLWTPRRDRKPCVAIVGDSIPNGSGDSPIAEKGFVARALGSVSTLAVSIPGSTVANFTSYSATYRLSMLRDCTSAVICDGANDLGISPTLATFQASSLNCWTLIARHGIAAYACTVTPRTTSTDSWATLANQTPHAANATRVSFNDWLRAGAPIDPSTKVAVAVGTSGALVAGNSGHPLQGYFDTADQAESARNSGKWAVSGAANYGTADGLHPSTAIHTLMATALDVTKLSNHLTAVPAV